MCTFSYFGGVIFFSTKRVIFSYFGKNNDVIFIIYFMSSQILRHPLEWKLSMWSFKRTRSSNVSSQIWQEYFLRGCLVWKLSMWFFKEIRSLKVSSQIWHEYTRTRSLRTKLMTTGFFFWVLWLLVITMMIDVEERTGNLVNNVEERTGDFVNNVQL